MTTPTSKLTYERDAAPAVLLLRRPKFQSLVDDAHFFKNSKFFSDMMNESQHRSTELSKEHLLQRKVNHAESAMSDELKQLKQKEILDRKRRQKLRNDCHELRQLAEQLRLASITKELDDHIAEVNRNRQMAKKVQVLGFQRAEAERQQHLAYELEREKRIRETREEFRKNLSNQIEDSERRRREKCVQKAAEREELIAIQRKIKEEDKAEQLRVERLREEKCKDMTDFIEQQKERAKQEKAKSLEDSKQIMAKQSEMYEQRSQIVAARREAQRKQEQISLKIGNQVYEIEVGISCIFTQKCRIRKINCISQNRKRQRNNLLLDLLEAEYKAKDDEHFRQQLEQEHVKRQRAREELERYRMEVAQRNMEEALLRQKQIIEKNTDHANIQNVDEIGLQERQKRREYGSHLLSMIEENNRKRADAAAENLKFFEMKAKTEAELQRQIEEERREMLGSVPASVLHYLPKQALSHSDREYFNVTSKTTNSIVPKTENNQKSIMLLKPRSTKK